MMVSDLTNVEIINNADGAPDVAPDNEDTCINHLSNNTWAIVHAVVDYLSPQQL